MDASFGALQPQHIRSVLALFERHSDPRYRNKTVNPWENRTGNGRSLIGAGLSAPYPDRRVSQKGAEGLFLNNNKKSTIFTPN